VGGSEEDGELKGKGEKWAVPLILNIPCHGGLLIVQACRRSLPVNLSQTQEKDGEGHKIWVVGLTLKNHFAGGLNIVP
jgi:hypothetical protein